MTENSSNKTNSPYSFRHEIRYLPNINTNDSKITQVNDGLSSDLEQSVNILDGSIGWDDKTVTPEVMAEQNSAVGEDDTASGSLGITLSPTPTQQTTASDNAALLLNEPNCSHHIYNKSIVKASTNNESDLMDFLI